MLYHYLGASFVATTLAAITVALFTHAMKKKHNQDMKFWNQTLDALKKAHVAETKLLQEKMDRYGKKKDATAKQMALKEEEHQAEIKSLRIRHRTATTRAEQEHARQIARVNQTHRTALQDAAQVQQTEANRLKIKCNTLTFLLIQTRVSQGHGLRPLPPPPPCCGLVLRLAS